MTAKKLTSREEIQVMRNLSQVAAARLVGRSARTFRDSDAPRLPGGRYDAAAILAWARDKAATDADPMLADGVESPGLERYRMARAGLAELDLLERQGALLSREKAGEALSQLAAMIRQLSDRLAKQFGNEVAEQFNETLDDFKTLVDERFGAKSQDGAAELNRGQK
jgi:phage terminase Nu1 subunit (DNA packaging protein)